MAFGLGGRGGRGVRGGFVEGEGGGCGFTDLGSCGASGGRRAVVLGKICTAAGYVHSTVLWTHIDVRGTAAWIAWMAWSSNES